MMFLWSPYKNALQQVSQETIFSSLVMGSFHQARMLAMQVLGCSGTLPLMGLSSSSGAFHGRGNITERFLRFLPSPASRTHIYGMSHVQSYAGEICSLTQRQKKAQFGFVCVGGQINKFLLVAQNLGGE